jgi:hypothetical protein
LQGSPNPDWGVNLMQPFKRLTMKYIIKPIVILWLLVLASSIIGCGSAEAIKGYRYPTTKDNLEKAVRKVIKNNPNIYLDSTTTKRILDSINLENRNKWTAADSANYYDHHNAYVRIKIKVGETENDYLFMYLGDKHYWESSTSSGILLSEVRDKYGKGLSQGHNENGQFKSKMAKEFTTLFETELVNKIDKELNLKHIDD